MKTNRSFFRAIRALINSGAVSTIEEIEFLADVASEDSISHTTPVKAWTVISDSIEYDYTQVTLQAIKGNFSLVILQVSENDNDLQVIPLTNFDVSDLRHIKEVIRGREIFEESRWVITQRRRNKK